jgi:WD40 repeat protein
MKPITLSGHSRPIKDLKFTSDSKYLFSGSSDRNVILWASETEQKIMSYEHTAAVNTIAITSDSNLLITGDCTGTFYIWDVNGGKLLKKMENDDLLHLKGLSLTHCDRRVVLVRSGRSKDSSSSIDVYNLLDIFMKDGGTLSIKSYDSLFKYETPNKIKFTGAKFSSDDKKMFLSRDDGVVQLLELNENKTILKEEKYHNNVIMDFDISNNDDILITASLDGSSNVVDFSSQKILNQFKPENPPRNINTCKLFPGINNNYDDLIKLPFHAVISGGQDSRNVTTTNAKEGGFDLEFLNICTGEIVGDIKAHFGPVNSTCFANNGKILASGAEDSTVRIHRIDDNMFK